MHWQGMEKLLVSPVSKRSNKRFWTFDQHGSYFTLEIMYKEFLALLACEITGSLSADPRRIGSRIANYQSAEV
jgi:hypothetical protein